MLSLLAAPRGRMQRLAFALAAVFSGGLPAQSPPATAPRVLRLGHQFPAAASLEEGDFRDRMCWKFAYEMERRTGGALRVEIFPSNKLVKPEQQLEALQKGAMELCLMPLNNTLERLPELNVTLLPGVIRSYEQAARWKKAPIGVEITRLLRDEGVVMLTWVWQAAGAVSIQRPLLLPEDARGMRLRGAGKSVDSLFRAAGAEVLSMPSSEIVVAFRASKLDAAVSSSTSLVAFKLQDFCRAVTTPRRRALFYFAEPLVIARSVLEALPAEHRRAILETGEALEAFAAENAKADDEKLARVYLAANASVADMDDEQFGPWQSLARPTAWRDYERSVPRGADWLQKALAVP